MDLGNEITLDSDSDSGSSFRPSRIESQNASPALRDPVRGASGERASLQVLAVSSRRLWKSGKMSARLSTVSDSPHLRGGCTRPDFS